MTLLPNPVEVDNAWEFLNDVTSPKEDFVVNTKESYSTLASEGKLMVQDAGDRGGWTDQSLIRHPCLPPPTCSTIFLDPERAMSLLATWAH